VIFTAHLGREYDRHPGARERAYGRATVSAGAAAVILHGAHVRRARVSDRSIPVHLGLGNLLFDQRDPRTRTGALITLRLVPGRPARVVADRCVDSHRGAVTPCPD
jgi:poly-gamma-glutamate capsule biosynthesis protein CapA/YwtB (metallophosphatase superfamily)